MIARDYPTLGVKEAREAAPRWAIRTLELLLRGAWGYQAGNAVPTVEPHLPCGPRGLASSSISLCLHFQRGSSSL